MAKVSRRNFIKTSTVIVAGCALSYAFGKVPILHKKNLLLRPPGALDEKLFLASCAKCGQCLQVCPPKVIKLAGINQGFGLGTPYITPRDGACILCKGLPCIVACPTGSLDHSIFEGKEASMGLAVLKGLGTCLSVKGENDIAYRLEKIAHLKTLPLTKIKNILKKLIAKLTHSEIKIWESRFGLKEISTKTLPKILEQFDIKQLEWLVEFMKTSSQIRESCRVCLDECPIKEEKPIIFEKRIDDKTNSEYIRPVVQKTCVGCGTCEMKCPTQIPSIVVIPELKWKESSVLSMDTKKEEQKYEKRKSKFLS